MQAYLYITRAFKDYTPHVMGALKLVAASYPPDELNRMGLGMYVSACPRGSCGRYRNILGWTARG